MKTRYLRLIVVVLALTVFPLVAKAEGDRVQELKRKLRERDKVILELLERVEALEQRVGVEHIAAEPSEASDDALEQAASKDKRPTESSQEMPGVVIVEEGAAERALRRSLTREGALLLTPGVLEVEPSFSYAREEDSTPRLFTSNSQLFAGEMDRKADTLTADVAVRLGLPWDSQLEIGLPYRWREVESVNKIGFVSTESTTQSGAALGDVRVGLAKTLLREKLWRPNLVGRVTWDTNSGKLSEKGLYLGGGFNEFRGSLTATKRQDPIAFVGGLSYEHSIEEEQIKPGPIISANFGSIIALSPETSIRFLLSGAYQDESKFSGNEIIGSDRTIASFVVGGSTLLAPGTLLNISVGLGLTDDADDFTVSLSLPFRFNRRLY
jgi:hypothetical protein